MKGGETVKAVMATIGLIAVFAGIIWGLFYFDVFTQGHFQPKYEAVRRKTFETSKSYNQGMMQELQNMQFQYEQASPEHKDALASIILHRAADYPDSELQKNSDLYSFIQKLRQGNNSKY